MGVCCGGVGVWYDVVLCGVMWGVVQGFSRVLWCDVVAVSAVVSSEVRGCVCGGGYSADSSSTTWYNLSNMPDLSGGGPRSLAQASHSKNLY